MFCLYKLKNTDTELHNALQERARKRAEKIGYPLHADVRMLFPFLIYSRQEDKASTVGCHCQELKSPPVPCHVLATSCIFFRLGGGPHKSVIQSHPFTGLPARTHTRLQVSAHDCPYLCLPLGVPCVFTQQLSLAFQFDSFHFNSVFCFLFSLHCSKMRRQRSN